MRLLGAVAWPRVNVPSGRARGARPAARRPGSDRRGCLGLGWRRGPGEAAGAGAGRDRAQRGGQSVAERGPGRRGDRQVVGPVGAVDRAHLAEHRLGVVRKYSLTGTCAPSISVSRACSQAVGSGGRPGSRRRRTSRSVTTPVPAARWCAPLGSRIAPTRSASAAISRRAAGLRASIVYRDVSTATRPPGRIRCRDLTMKWLWIVCPAGLWRRSCSTTCPNGTLPIARS